MAIYERMTVKGRGGALPTYNGHDAPYTPGSGVNVRVSGADARVLAAAQRMEADAVKDLVRAGGNALKIGLTAYEDYSKTKATELATKYKMGMREAMYGDGGILTREGEAAFTAEDDVLERSRKLKGDLLKDYSGSHVEELFNRVVEYDEADYAFKAQEYQGKQYRVFQDRTDEAAFTELADMAMRSYANPEAFAKNIGESLYYQEQILRRKGYSGEALDAGLKATSSKVFSGAIEQALLMGDVDAAQAVLDRGREKRMTAEDVALAVSKIKTRREAMEKQAEADAKKADAERVMRESEDQTQTIMQTLNAFPDGTSQEVKMAHVIEMTKNIDDDAVRDNTRKLVERKLKEQDVTQKAETVVAANDFYRQTQGQKLTEQLAELDKSGLPDRIKGFIRAELTAPIEDKSNRLNSEINLRVYRQWIDNSPTEPDKDQRRAMMLDLRLNAEDRVKAEEYKGKHAEYSQFRIDGLIDSVFGKGKIKDAVKAQIYTALLADPEVSGGNKLTDKQLKEKIAVLNREANYTDSSGDKDEFRLYKLANDGKLSGVRIEVPDAMKETLTQEIRKAYPFYVYLNDKKGGMAERFMQYIYTKRQGINVTLSNEEEQAIRAAIDKYNNSLGGNR